MTLAIKQIFQGLLLLSSKVILSYDLVNFGNKTREYVHFESNIFKCSIAIEIDYYYDNSFQILHSNLNKVNLDSFQTKTNLILVFTTI